MPVNELCQHSTMSMCRVWTIAVMRPQVVQGILTTLCWNVERFQADLASNEGLVRLEMFGQSQHCCFTLQV